MCACGLKHDKGCITGGDSFKHYESKEHRGGLRTYQQSLESAVHRRRKIAHAPDVVRGRGAEQPS